MYQGENLKEGLKRELFEEYRPLFETIGKKEKLEYIGPIGSAHLLKSTNNFLTATSCVATSEAMCVLANAGIDLNLAAKVISNSSGSNNSTQVKFPEIVFPGNNWNFIVDLMMKDVNLFIKAAEGFGVPTNVSSKIIEILKKETELFSSVSPIKHYYKNPFFKLTINHLTQSPSFQKRVQRYNTSPILPNR